MSTTATTKSMLMFSEKRKFNYLVLSLLIAVIAAEASHYLL